VRRLGPYVPLLRARSSSLEEQMERALISVPLNVALETAEALGWLKPIRAGSIHVGGSRMAHVGELHGAVARARIGLAQGQPQPLPRGPLPADAQVQRPILGAAIELLVGSAHRRNAQLALRCWAVLGGQGRLQVRKRTRQMCGRRPCSGSGRRHGSYRARTLWLSSIGTRPSAETSPSLTRLATREELRQLPVRVQLARRYAQRSRRPCAASAMA
jgi:hypothetical protein